MYVLSKTLPESWKLHQLNWLPKYFQAKSLTLKNPFECPSLSSLKLQQRSTKKGKTPSQTTKGSIMLCSNLKVKLWNISEFMYDTDVSRVTQGILQGFACTVYLVKQFNWLKQFKYHGVVYGFNYEKEEVSLLKLHLRCYLSNNPIHYTMSQSDERMNLIFPFWNDANGSN